MALPLTTSPDDFPFRTPWAAPRENPLGFNPAPNMVWQPHLCELPGLEETDG